MRRGRVDAAVGDGLARLTLVAPDGLNAIDPLWVAELDAAVAAIERDDSVRALLVAAEGAAFTVGGDLRHFASRTGDLAVALEEMVPPYHATLERLAALERPVVCALNGSIGGGGLGLLYCADIALAVPSARFACGFARLGLSGDGGSSWYLPRLVGLRRAQELMIGGRELSAAEAVEWGLVTRVVEPDALRGEAEAVARRLAGGPTLALGRMRRLLRESWGASVGEQLASETEAMLLLGATGDAAEGIASFAERRDPGFFGA